MGFLSRCLLLCLFGTAISAVSFAGSPHDRTQFGRDIVVGPNDEVSQATCFGCTVRVRGQISGDVTTFGGSVVVEDDGEIAGDATTFGGDIRLGRGVKVNGDVTVFGGKIRRDPEAIIHSDVTNFGSGIWLFVIFGLPFVFLGGLIALAVWLVRRLLRPSVPAAA